MKSNNITAKKAIESFQGLGPERVVRETRREEKMYLVVVMGCLD